MAGSGYQFGGQVLRLEVVRAPEEVGAGAGRLDSVCRFGYPVAVNLTRQQILDTVAALKPEMARTYKVRSVSLFGSAARDQHGPGSDVDVLVDFAEGADLFDLVGLSLLLEERLGCPVDVVPRRALRPEIRDWVVSELVSV